MSALHQLTQQLARFDDEAFAALANKGLLRRAYKDLEKYSEPKVEEASDKVSVSLGEHRIQFDARGPAHAKCSCPATNICQHILSAAIFLQRAASHAGPEQEITPTAELLRISPDELTRHAGKAGYRWAWQFVQDLDAERGLAISGERHLVLTLDRPRVTFRYLGGGLASMIADIEIAQIEKYRVAVVLALQRANGIESLPPEPTGRARGLDFGKDHAPISADAAALAESRSRLLTSTQQLMCECTELGLSHLSSGIHERFATLAVWAQGADYYRLALLLRRIADHVEQLLERAGGADEHRLLDELTLAYGLVSSLEQAARHGKSPAHLVGAARSRYEQMHSCELLGLGAVPWRSAAGYIGLTMLFWSPSDNEFMSCTDARPEAQGGGFDPRARYKAAGPWSGLGAPALATGRRLRLSGAQINGARRLSASDNTSVSLLPPDPPGQFASQLKDCSSWLQVIDARIAARRSLLAEPQPMNDWAVLRPQRFGAAKFDGVRQVLLWPLYDGDDHLLVAELAYSEYASHAIARLEALKSNEPAPGTLLVARLHPGINGIVAEPLSLVRTEPADNGVVVDALHFDAAPEQGAISRVLESLQLKRPPELLTAYSGGLGLGIHIPTFLIEYRQELRQRAERGVGHDAAQSQEVSRWAERAADLGFTAFKQTSGAQLPPPAALLRSNYIRLQYERLLGDAENEAV